MALPKSLAEGYRRFVRDRHGPNRGRSIQLSELGQAPTAMVIACCDARIDVSAIFDAEAGELFILRNIANLVPNYEPDDKHHGTSAAIEFAVQELKVPHLIVLGHSHCGGIEAFRQKVRNNVPERGFIGSWLTLLDGIEIAESDVFTYGEATAFELAGVRSSLQKLREFPFVRKPEQEGLLSLHGAHFDIATGGLLLLDEASGSFAADDGKSAAA